MIRLIVPKENLSQRFIRINIDIDVSARAEEYVKYLDYNEK